jgi:hypothetical protein
MDITAFGETKSLEQHLWDIAFNRPNLLDQGYVDLMLMAYAKLESQKRNLAEAQARETAILERLDRIEKLLTPQERRWLVKGKVNHTPYMNQPQRWEDTRIITASTREDAERLFVQHWNNKSEQHGDSYWATVTNCSAELG